MTGSLIPQPNPGTSSELAPLSANGRGDMPLNGPEGGAIPWLRYLAAVQRHRWLIMAFTVTGLALGVAATRFIRPEYTATATIFIEKSREAGGPIRPEGLLESSGWVDLMRSWVVLDSTSVRLRLYLKNEPGDSLAFAGFGVADRFSPGNFVLTVRPDGRTFELHDQRGTLVEAGSIGDSIGRRIGFRWAPPAAALGRDRKIRFSVVTPREASAALIKLTILAATIQEQVQTTRADLERAENALESFRTSTITLPNEGVPVAAGLLQTQPTVISNFFRQKIELEQLRTDRKALEDVLAKTQAGELAVDAFQTIPAVRAAPDLTRALTELSNAEAELRALRNRYTDEYKPLRDLADRIAVIRQSTIPAYANALIAQLRNQEQALESQISTAAADIQKIPERTIMEQRLTREASSAAELFTNLQNRYEEAKLSLASAIPDVRVLVPAVAPSRPNRNRAPIIILIGFIAGLGGGVGLAILMDVLDKRFRYPEQVTDELGLSILGAVPAIRKKRDGPMNDEETSQVVEAFRTIRLNLAHSYGAAGPVLLTISSPGPGEGKSLVSSNLALSFADAGYQTLLVDGDIRRGELHRMFNVDRRPGLMDYLAGSCPVEDVVRPSGHRGLSVVACGTRRQQGPELLGSTAMTLFMADMKARFNVIIVDSPPMGAGIDPFVLSTATGHLLLVLRSGETDRALAEAKLKLLDRLPIRLLGAVLNDIRATEGAYKYYGYVYGYSAEEDGSPAQISSRAGSEIS
jgi:capsular exopolysaccharide synthesis family protein